MGTDPDRSISGIGEGDNCGCIDLLSQPDRIVADGIWKERLAFLAGSVDTVERECLLFRGIEFPP